MTEQTDVTALLLAVDDDEHVLEMLQAGLGRAGYKCVGVESARQALVFLQRDDFDLVLLDINMPEKSGMDLLPDIKAQHPDVAVMMLTGEAEVSLAVRAMREGAYDYALKPVGLAELIIRIEHALSRRALLRENRVYQQRLEQIVDELNGRLARRGREVTALNNMLQSQIGQNEVAQRSLIQLQDSLNSFSAEIQGLATIVGITRQEDKETEPKYRVKKVT